MNNGQSVSYTHLDVYKRQILGCLAAILFGQAWYSKNGLYIMLVLIAITVAWSYFLYKKSQKK